ncbi:alpha/beta fold hydrolase [Natronorubrum bangense]|uniref:Arylesterase, non-heme chloride peroxidase n=2 Tax=Natronorubrum bangense TaxID=61858 RepID=L9WBA6_9EURY|nr:alpha/beta hydrolase [Natronorubrum bangense]ELY46536.1 arylesterase, non-heme chloride peroxidase [Natronorubrum bangense JCM 10635]QCC56541.1 alpha/beta hydrolase [Natronorubrum bangense]
MPYFSTTDNVELYYEDKGDGVPVVFLHGWTCNRHFFSEQISALREEYRVISLDLRGHGDSGYPQQGLTLERLATDVDEITSYLGLSPVSFVGWSMGAHVIFEYVEQFGCDNLERLVLIDMSPKLLTDDEWDLGLYGEFSHEENLETLALFTPSWDRVAGDIFRDLLDKLSDEQLEWVTQESEKTPTNTAVNLWVAMVTNDYRETLPGIDVPTLVTYGEESNLYAPETAEFMTDQIPNSELVGFSDVGHGVPLGAPEELTEELEEFL